MALWIQQYMPNCFEELMFNQEQARRLKRIAQHDDFPHLLFHGPDGAGKRTLLRCLLREVYGEGAAQLKHTKFDFDTASGKHMTLNAVSSVHHIEIRPS